MIDIKFLRENPEIVKENIKKKFQDEKLPLVDEVIALDAESRKVQQEADNLRSQKNKLAKQIGGLMGQIKKAEGAGNAAEAEEKKKEAESLKAESVADDARLAELEAQEPEFQAKIREIMYKIPNIIDASVPVGKDDSENVEIEKFGEPVVPDFEVPHHADILKSISGLDKESAGRTSGDGFYYLMGDAARLHSAMLSYARDFMINKGFIYCIPPFMIRSDVVNGVMSFKEMEAMMYKIEGEDLYLIGTSEHSMIGKFKGEIVKEDSLPITMTSYSPCFRKEVGSHGIEERGLYRVHQFEKQEMVVLCKPEESMDWYNKMWSYTVEFFRSLDVPVRTLECCSGDLADLKVKSCDVEAWSPRQQKYFEVGSCSTLGDAQARRLGIRTKGSKGTYFVHTLNNTVLATPRGLIAFLENNLNADGSINIPKALQPYMGGKEKIVPTQK
jgi:seryl-tRNA synthetase